MNYQTAIEYIESLSQYGIVPGLDSIKELCKRVGDPQKDLSFVHIAGSNGKGSTLAYVSTILKCAGYKVGRYISPTIFDYRERIQVNHKPISQKTLISLVEEMKEVCETMVADGLPHPTPFEVETAMAFLYFKAQGCDIVVLETGMGGLMDATNLIENTKVAVLTSISMDHMQYLGNTLGKIAAQKAGIIKPGSVVVSLPQEDEAMESIQKQVAACNTSLVIANPTKAGKIRLGLEKQRFDYAGMKDLEITMAGSYQIENAVLATQVILELENCGFPVREAALRKGLKETEWQGRFTLLAKKPMFIVDGAHNEDAAVKLAKSIETYFPEKRIIYILGILRDKEYNRIIELTHGYADHILTVTPPNNKRAMSAYELATEVAKVHPSVTAVDSLEEAVEVSHLLAGKEDVIIAFGSLSYLGRLIDIVLKKRGNYDRSGKDNGRRKAFTGRNR